MTATQGGAATFDVESLRRGVEQRDVATMLGLYDDDAEILISDRDHTPSRPQVVRGRAEIGAYLSDVLGREMTHRLDHIVAGEDTVSFVERCTYPDGTRVLFSTVLDVDHGRIRRQEGVQAWDTAGPDMPDYRDFTEPDEVREFPNGRLEILRLAAGDVGRMVLEPGWRWSASVGPIAGTELCQTAHFGYQIAGVLRVQMADGTTLNVRPGQAGTIPPGHDAWVVGDEPVITLDWAGASSYAR